MPPHPNGVRWRQESVWPRWLWRMRHPRVGRVRQPSLSYRAGTTTLRLDVGQRDVCGLPRTETIDVTFRKERYHADWPTIREGIRLRANNACEQCRAPNGDVIARGGGRDAGTYMLMDGLVSNAETGAPMGHAKGSEYDADRFVRVILTVAHIDHDESNNAPENLRSLCQRCHFSLDRSDNQNRKRANTLSRKAVGNLPGVK